MIGSESPGLDRGTLHPRTAELQAEYRAYRTRQAGRLAHSLPKEAVRPLYRAAVEHFGAPAVEDPLALLVAYCEEVVLPLPTYDVWARDRERNPHAHIEDVDGAPGWAPTADRPSALDSMIFAALGRTWTAQLRGWRDVDAWRGCIEFSSGPAGEAIRTSAIFREPDLAGLSQRFRDLREPALKAFLRSVLP